MIDLAADYRKRGWTRDGLAKRVAKLWDPTGKVSYRNVGNQIAQLEKGQRTWWLKRPDAGRALAEVLEVDAEDLGLGSGSPDTGAVVPFADFPAVRPFDPRSEEPCELGNERWFDFPDAFEEGKRTATWIHAPAGTGWSLFGEIYRWRHKLPVQTVRTLSEVVDRRPDDWLVIQLRSPDDASDPEVEKRLCRRGRTIVCARFAPWVGGRGLPLDADSSPTPSDPAQWRSLGWRPRPDWRAHFIGWLAGRVEGGPGFNDEQLVGRLQEQDPSSVLFPSPADVLAIAGFAHEVGARSWTQLASEQLPARWIAGRIRSDPANVVESWLASSAREAVVQMVHRWVESTASWLQPQARATWCRWLPQASPAARSVILERHLAELEKLRSPAKRAQKKQALLATAGQPDPEGLFLKLEADRVLVPGGASGEWLFQPTWLAAWLGAQHVDALVRAPDVLAWGRVAIDLDRQELVDQALDRLDGRDLQRLMAGASSWFERRALPAVAAIESLFLAVGRRLGRGERPESAALMPLWEWMTLSLDHRREGLPLVPVTRPGPAEGDVGSRWLEACWEWSAALPKPEELQWLFPRWFDLDFEALPPWFRRVTAPPYRLMVLAERLLGERATGRMSRSVPNWIRGPVDAARLIRGESLSSAEILEIADDSEALTYLLERAPEMAPASRSQLAVLLWHRARGERRQFRSNLQLRTFVTSNLSEEEFSRVLEHGDVPSEFVSSLSRGHQQMVIQHWLEHRPEELAMYLEDAAEVDEATLQLVADRLEPRSGAARLVWRRDPELALRCSERALLERREYAADWFIAGEREHATQLLDLLERLPRPPDWTAPWLARRLLVARPADAERIYALRLRLRG